MELIFKHLHNILNTACIVEIHNRIRPARDYRIDTVDFFGVFFKIRKSKIDPQFICIC